MIGPVLFLIYINDLPTGIKSKINIFADDTKIASKVDTVGDEEIVMMILKHSNTSHLQTA